MKLQLPFRQFTHDADAHESNVRAIERYVNEPLAGVMLEDHEELPDPERWPVGALVRSNGTYYQRDAEGWSALIPEGQDTFSLYWSTTHPSFDVNAALDDNEYFDEHYLDVLDDAVLYKVAVKVHFGGAAFGAGSYLRWRLYKMASPAQIVVASLDVPVDVTSGFGNYNVASKRTSVRLNEEADYAVGYQIVDPVSGAFTMDDNVLVTASMKVRRA